MKTQHDRDCTIYAALDNINMPEAGICTCGYGHQLMRQGDSSESYSKELEQKLEKENKNVLLDTIKFDGVRSLKNLRTLLEGDG